MVLLKWYFVHTSKTLGRWGSVVEARSCQWQHPTVSLFCIVLDVTRYQCTILSGYNYGFEEPVDYILILRSQRASSRGPGSCMIPPINPVGVWKRKTRISHGILQCQAFSNDFVSNVKPSSKNYNKIHVDVWNMWLLFWLHCGNLQQDFTLVPQRKWQ